MKPLSAPTPPASSSSALVWQGEHPVPALPGLAEVEGAFVDRDGGRFYRITHHDRLPPFLMTVVSAGDHWLFVASNGGITAGRVRAERALFPYRPVDRIYDGTDAIGPFTCLLVSRGDHTQLWEPFSATGRTAFELSRHLYKSVEGHRLVFEEVNRDLGLTFSAEWTTSDRFGLVRRVRVANDGFDPVEVRVLDGLRDLLPSGIPRRLQAEMSCLTDAYKRSEVVPGTTLAIYALSCGITDQPEALESLVATVAWCDGLPDARVLVTARQFDAFRQGEWPAPESGARGVRGVYAVCARFDLAAGGAHRWQLVADEGLSQSAVVELAGGLARGELGSRLDADLAAGTRRLRELVGGADGLQSGADEATTGHHFANVLFNIMRGGTFLHGYAIPREDFVRFLEGRNHAVARAHAAWLSTLPAAVHVEELRTAVRARGDANLERLFLEYLPLGFSRRHGDPSRPWNQFSIRLRDASGREAFEYEGNWRDIFQNWEALGTAFPGFLEHMVAKFVNASTVDGYNPYRVTRRGVEWEVPAPDDPWAGIGYWGDHQVIYLLKLLEWAEHFAPGRFHQWLERPVFSYAAVPYRIASYAAMRQDPRATISFCAEQHASILEREAAEGSDARLVRDGVGAIRHVTLTEKLLLCALTRLSNLIPGGGIWMNTQRPEWNDANNALVGFGVSGVTLFHLRRYLVFCRDLFAELATRDVYVTAAVGDFARAIGAALGASAGREAEVVADPRQRREMVDALAGAGSIYREHVYRDGLGEPVRVPGTLVTDVIAQALPLVEATLRALRREDGLYHAYRLLHFPDEQTLTLEDLPLMLEGQVAVLASGALDSAETVVLLRALRASSLYREDCRSYLLYPDGNPPGFLERNVIPADVVAGVPLLSALLDAGDRRLVVRDAAGAVRFAPDLVNEPALAARLAQLRQDPAWAGAVARDAAAVHAAYERVFRHRAFTGRSGAMFAYEGLGCVYWHMVSKLLVGVQEAHARAVATASPAAPELARFYQEVRAGLGFNKSPVEWGAFPTDPYSHTPGHAGAQQPGMTGQAKEGVLARLGELGVEMAGGRVRFAPRLLSAREFSPTSHRFAWCDVTGAHRELELPPGTLAFTLCGTLVVYTLGDGVDVQVMVHRATGGAPTPVGETMDSGMVAGLFARAGEVTRIDVAIGRERIQR